jgi:hypothetical protein
MTRRTFLRTSRASALVLGAAGQPAWAQKKQVVTIAFPETITRRPSWGTPEKGALTTRAGVRRDQLVVARSLLNA